MCTSNAFQDSTTHASSDIACIVYALEFNELNIDNGWASKQSEPVPKLVMDLGDVLSTINVGQLE